MSRQDELSDTLAIVIIGLGVLVGIGILQNPQRLQGAAVNVGALIQAANLD